MGQFGVSGERLGRVIAQVHATPGGIVYQQRDSKGDPAGPSRPMADVPVIPLESDAYEAEDGRIWGRAIQVEIHDAYIDGWEPALLDTVTWRSHDWSVSKIREAVGMWYLICVREEQQTKQSAAQVRRFRRVAEGDNTG